MSDARASVCQAIGLTVGSELSSTLFFLLLGRGLLDLERLLQIMSGLGFLVLGFFTLRMLTAGQGDTQEDQEEELVGVMEVLRRIVGLVTGPVNFKIWLCFVLLIPMLGGHSSLLAVRYQAAGFSPEVFA